MGLTQCQDTGDGGCCCVYKDVYHYTTLMLTLQLMRYASYIGT